MCVLCLSLLMNRHVSTQTSVLYYSTLPLYKYLCFVGYKAWWGCVSEWDWDANSTIMMIYVYALILTLQLTLIRMACIVESDILVPIIQWDLSVVSLHILAGQLKQFLQGCNVWVEVIAFRQIYWIVIDLQPRLNGMVRSPRQQHSLPATTASRLHSFIHKLIPATQKII